MLFEQESVEGRAVCLLLRHRSRNKLCGDTNTIVWSQSAQLLLCLEAMKSGQTGRDNILYLLDTEVYVFLSTDEKQ